MKIKYTIESNAHNEAEASTLKRLLVSAFGFAVIEDDVLSNDYDEFNSLLDIDCKEHLEAVTEDYLSSHCAKLTIEMQ